MYWVGGHEELGGPTLAGSRLRFRLNPGQDFLVTPFCTRMSTTDMCLSFSVNKAEPLDQIGLELNTAIQLHSKRLQAIAMNMKISNRTLTAIGGYLIATSSVNLPAWQCSRTVRYDLK